MKKICILLLVSLCAQVFGQRSVQGPKPSSSTVFRIESKQGGLLIPRLTSEQIRAMETPDEGLMVINVDKRCLSVYFNGSWHCLLKGGGSSFSKGFYPVVGKLASDCSILSGVGFSTYSLGAGRCNVSFPVGVKLLAATASIIETNSGEDWDLRSRASILGHFDRNGSVTNDGSGLSIQTSGSDGQPAKRPVWFIALVRGPALPDYAERRYPLGAVVNADGTTESGVGFSVQRTSTGVYKLSFAKGLKVLAINATIKDADRVATRGIKLADYDGFQYETSDENGTLRDAAVSFTAMVQYSFEATPLLKYSQRMRSGAIEADGKPARGHGFTVEKSKTTPGEYTVTIQGVKGLRSVTANLWGDPGAGAGRSGVVIRSIQGASFTYATARWDASKQAADLPIVFNAVVY